jgi:chromosome segregation ATPase
MLTTNTWLDELETLHRKKFSVEQRLDRLEEEMESVKQLLNSAANVTQSNSEAIKQLTDRIDHLTARTERLAISQENAQTMISQLALLMAQFTQSAEADRTVLRGIQAENKRIISHLFN